MSHFSLYRPLGANTSAVHEYVPMLLSVHANLCTVHMHANALLVVAICTEPQASMHTGLLMLEHTGPTLHLRTPDIKPRKELLQKVYHKEFDVIIPKNIHCNSSHICHKDSGLITSNSL